MGCCLSRTTPTAKPSPTPHPKLRDPRPPLPPLEEETVKEVLTETPNNEALKESKKSLHDSKVGNDVVEVKQQKPQQEEQRNEKFEIEIHSADIEVSEITVATENRSVTEVSVSLSESVSVGAGEKRGEEVMSKSRDRADALHVSRTRQRSADQSPAKVLKRRPYSGEQKRVRSPAKRPSPEKKTHLAARAPRGRSQSPAASNSRNVMNAGPARIRRDSGDRSGRRSRSPARNRGGPGTEVNARVNAGQRQYEESRRTGTVEEDEEACPAADESLDNPLVSLECFIFL